MGTRRDFLGRLAGGYAVLLNGEPAVQYAGCADCIEVFRQEGAHKRTVQRVPSANPSFVALDAKRQRLFAVNEIDEYEGLPLGTVESYAIVPDSGRIELVSRRKLALSATRPRHLAISPDGRWLVVAVYGGGSYNVLPVTEDGAIESVAQIVKEVGYGVRARPHSVTFDPSGKFVIATDFACGWVSLFSFDGELKRMKRLALVRCAEARCRSHEHERQ